MSEEKLYLYPAWVRIWHGLNLILILLLIISGLGMQYANPNIQILPFSLTVSIHNITGILLAILFVAFIIGNRITDNGKFYKVKKNLRIRKLVKQFKYYTIGIFKKEEPPYPVTKKRKFNPLQLFSYIVIMYILFPILIISGIVLLFPEFIPHKIFGISGIHLTDIIHIVVGYIISLFLVIHVYFCTLGKTPLSNFKCIINGWHQN